MVNTRIEPEVERKIATKSEHEKREKVNMQNYNNWKMQ
mgnify:CR=1 FL=1